MFNDTQSPQKLAKSYVFHNRSKHIDVRHFFVRTDIESKYVLLNYLNTKDMPAGILKKDSCQKHFEFIKDLGITEK